MIVVVIITSCSTTRHVPQGEYLLDKVKITVDSGHPEIKAEDFNVYLRQQPNYKMLWSAKLRLGIYDLSGQDSTKWWNRWIRKLGEPPVIYDSSLTESSVRQLQTALNNKGYLNAKVEADTISTGNKKITVDYRLSPGKLHTIRTFDIQIADTAIRNIVNNDSNRIIIFPGQPLDLNSLDLQRELITTRLRNKGYYDFVKENIKFEADTTAGSLDTDLTMTIEAKSIKGLASDRFYGMKQYAIRKVVCVADYEANAILAGNANVSDIDTVSYHGLTILYGKDRYLRPEVIYENNFIQPGEAYSERRVDRTYQAFSRLEILKFVNIRFEPAGSVGDTGLLDAYILLTPGKSMSMSAELEGTNSEGDLGIALGLTFSHRNIGKGSETITAKLRGAYEAIHGNYEGLLHKRYMEYSAEAAIQFPKFKAPFLAESFKRRINSSTEIHLSMNYQERPEYTRIISTAGWSYKWTERRSGNRHTFTPLDINYVYLPESTNDFINQIAPDNPLLRYSYEDHFIMRLGYGFYHTNKRTPRAWERSFQPDIYTIRLNAEIAGNLLFLINSIFTHRSDFHQNPYKIFGIHYSQYFKFDSDFGYTHIFDNRNSIATRIGLGIGVPYGNSGMLPFEKRFYGGGANGVRGWAVRTLGPGAFRSVNAATDYMNQCGDIRFIMSGEYRTKLFWIVELGAFVDIGNIWTIHNYPAQPDGMFKFNQFYKQFAAAYGLGIRLDFDYFLLRFDLGMKAHNPAKDAEPWPLIHPRWGRDRAFHFSIGYPF